MSKLRIKFLFTPSNSVWFSLRRLSLTSQLLNGIAWKYLLWNSIKIDGEITFIVRLMHSIIQNLEVNIYVV